MSRVRPAVLAASLAALAMGAGRVPRAGTVPARFAAADASLAGRVAWSRVADGVEAGTLVLDVPGEAWRVRVALARLDPARVAFALDAAVHEGAFGAWTLDRAPAAAVAALNAGQFTDRGPWGWVVHRGHEHQAPGTGPLAPAFVVDADGRVALVPPDSVAAVRAAGRAVEAFQSYPALLLGDGEVPAPLRADGLGVDRAHRDRRLALGVTRDGAVLVALTSVEGMGPALAGLPLGPTVPEMAALMGGLGARRAMLLDGGLSGQLLVRGADGARRAEGWRAVPLGLVARPR